MLIEVIVQLDIRAVTALEGKAKVVQEYEQAVKNAHEALNIAEGNLGRISTQYLTDARTQAQNAVTEARQNMAEERAAKAQEQAAKAEEEEARQENNNVATFNAQAFADQLREQGYDVTPAEMRKIKKMAMKMQREFTPEASARRAAFVDKVSQMYGVNIAFADDTSDGTVQNPNGYYDSGSNTITLNKNATVGDAMYAVLGHELTHAAESSGTYGDLASALLRIRYGNDIGSFDDFVRSVESGENRSQAASDILAKQQQYSERTGKAQTTEYAAQEVAADIMGEILKGNQEMANRLAGENPGVVRRVINTIKDFLKKLAGIEGPYIKDMQNVVDMLGNALNEAQDQQKEDAGKKYDYGRVNDPDYLLNGKEYFDYDRNLSNRNYSNGQYEQRSNGGFIVDMGPLLVYSNAEGVVEHVLDVSDQTVNTASKMKDMAFDLAKGELDFEDQREIIDSMSDKEDSAFRSVGYGQANKGNNGRGTAEYSEQDSGRNRTQVSAEGEISDAGTVSDDWHARVYGTKSNTTLKYSFTDGEVTLPSMGIDPAYAFKYSDADVEQAEQTIRERESDIKDIIQREGFKGLQIQKPDGRVEVLTPSIRKGVLWQLSYFGNDGVATMHENYGQTSDASIDEAIYPMEDLYSHFANMTLQNDLAMRTLDETTDASNEQEGFRYSLPSDDTLESMLRSFMANGVLVAQMNSGTRGQQNKYSFHGVLAIKENAAHSINPNGRIAEAPVTAQGNVSINSILREIAGYNVINGQNSDSAEQQNDSLRYSLPSDDTLESMLRSFMANGGMLSTNVTPPGTGLPGPANTNSQGPRQRQFGSQTAQRSDALHEEVKQYLRENSDYDPDTNREQIDRAMAWVQDHATDTDPTGYYGALQEATSDSFDPYTADGQARMLTLMGMAALADDVAAETQIADAYNRQGTAIGQMLQARKMFQMMTPLGRKAALG